MLSWMTTAALGIIALSYLPQLPGRELMFGLQALALLLALISRRAALQAHVLALVVLTAFSYHYFSLRVQQIPPEALEGKDLLVLGEVVGPVERRSGARSYYRMPVRLLDGQCGPAYCPPGLPRFRLNYYGETAPAPGGLYRFQVRIKRPYGTHSPGAFDYGRWLFSRGFSAVGYIRSYQPEAGVAGNRGLTDSMQRAYWRWHTQLLAAGEHMLAPYRYGNIMRALLFADRRDISPALWQVFAHSGTSHIMAISGMHIGMVFGGLWLLVAVFTRCCQGGRWGVIAGPSAGMLGAFCYAAMAGFGIPTQRALLMIAIFALGFIARRRISPWQSFQLALLAVLIVQPLAAHQIGFILSFSAVACLLYVFHGRKRSGRNPVWGALKAQVAVMLGLLPVLSALGFPQPLASLPVNLLVIPLLGFCLLPLLFCGLLLALLCPIWSHAVFGLVDQVLACTVSALSAAAELAGVGWLLPAPAAIVFAVLGIAILLLPRGLPGKPLGALLVAGLLLWRPSQVEPEELRVTVFDVGQGLAVLLETQRRVLLYDVGPDTDSGYNSADSVIAPLLRRRDIHRIDALVISHGDRDHAGSVGPLLKHFPVGVIYAGEALKSVSVATETCSGSWTWQGFSFRFINLISDAVTSANNASCVLRVEGVGQALLLTGDIEAPMEQRLLNAAAAQLKSTLLVAPHHGSRSSSSSEFVRAVDPELVIFAAGRKHRYGHPHREVVARYAAQGARCWHTGQHGTVSFLVSADGVSLDLQAQNGRYFWQPVYAELCANAD